MCKSKNTQVKPRYTKYYEYGGLVCFCFEEMQNMKNQINIAESKQLEPQFTASQLCGAMGPMRDPTRSPPAPPAPVEPAEPAPATDRTDAPLVATKAPTSEMPKMDCSMAGVATFGFKVVDFCGLPSPPGGWLGPFGFFRLVTYAFVLMSLLAVFLGIMAATGQPFNGVPIIGSQPDGFATFAALLLCLGALVSAGAAYAHEGLEQEVTAMAKQNEIFRTKNEMLAAQLDELGGVRKKLDQIQQKMGENLQQFEETLQELHTVSCAELLQMMLEAFMNADLAGKA